MKNNIPFLGVGIGFRSELKQLIFLNRDKIGFVEIIADHYMDAPDHKMYELEVLKNNFTVIPHALNLSLGSSEGVDIDYVKKLKNIIDLVQPPYWSEHISFTKAHGHSIGHLAPIVYNREFLEILKKNIATVRSHISQPLILENITYHLDLPGKQYDDAEFLNRLCAETGCGLLLDITNLYINCRNFRSDPFKFLDKLDLQNIIQLHFVGYENSDDVIIDTHSTKTQKDIFDIIRFLLERHVPNGILLERDENLGATEEILDDLDMARSLLRLQPA